MESVKTYCKNHNAYNRGYLNYSTWRRTISYCIDTTNKYRIKKLFNELIEEDFFIIKKVNYRYYYKVNDVNDELNKTPLIIYFP